MEELEALVPGICRFLEEDLSQEALSSPCRFRWQQLINRLEVLRLGESPPRPGVTLRPTKANRKAKSLPNKRFSLPTNVLIPPATNNAEDMYEEPSRLLQPPLELKEADVEESSGTEFENDEADDSALSMQDIILPKKIPSRRLSSTNFLDQPWTLVGPLSHRYKQQKWQRLAFCVLAGLRLTGFKSTHSANPSLTVFLSGYTAIYAERDTGMAHVVKLTHPHQDMYVIAADTEEQALVWAEQVNQYSRGITPSEVKSFMEHSVVQDGQEDSGFSAPVSSGSEGGSGDGVVENAGGQFPNPQLLQQHRRSLGSLGGHSPMHVCLTSCPTSTTTVTTTTAPSVSTAGSFCRPVVEGPNQVVTRGSSLISSMRRKVESLSARRKSRKSLSLLPVHFTPSEDAILTGVASLRVVNPQITPGLPVGWVERWCQLRPGKLETYRLDSPNVEMDVSLEGVSLGLSNDKKHHAALRLTSPDPGVDLMLFEVQDKIQMGTWIRGFIQALGIISSVPYEAIVDWLPCGSNTVGTTSDEPVYDEVASPVGAAGVPFNGDVARGTPTFYVAQSPTPSLSSAPNRLAPLPPLPIQTSSCVSGISAGGSSDPSADYYGSSRNSVQTVVEAAGTIECTSSGMEERRKRLAELVNRRRGAEEGGGEPLYAEYEESRSLLSRPHGHRRTSSDPLEAGQRDCPPEAKIPALRPTVLKMGKRREEETETMDAMKTPAVRPSVLNTGRRKEEAMEIDDNEDEEETFRELEMLGAPPPPPPPPPRQDPCLGMSTASTPTSCSSSGGAVALRPRSLLRKTSVELAQEEMENLRQDIAGLRRKKSDLRRRGFNSETEIKSLEDEIRQKDDRLRSLEHSTGRRRFSFQSCSSQ